MSAIDKDFVEKFSKCSSKILNKKTNYSVCKLDGRGYSPIYSSRARSKRLFYFLKEMKNDFEKVKPFAEEYPKEFIQGLADSEGCPSISAKSYFKASVMVACSTNNYLLKYVQDLLKKCFEIETKDRLIHSAGKTDSIINGRPITRTKNLYGLYCSDFNDVKKFSSLIRFSIARKQEKLVDGIRVDLMWGKDRVRIWRELYVKKGCGWVKNK